MRILLRDRCYIQGLDKDLKNIIKRDLKVPNPKYKDAVKFGRYTRGIKKEIIIFEETTDGLAVPRGYIPTLAEYTDDIEEVIDETVLPSLDEPIESKITLRPYQVPWVEDLLSSRYGIGIAPPGSGKTVAGLEIIARLNTKALWLTHTTPLAHQAINRIDQFLDVSSVGFIGSGKETLGDITVALVQTLSKRDLSQYIDSFGVVIPDECHLVPGECTFLRVVNKLAPRYVYGLTATPYRKDGLENLMFLSVGPTVAEMEKKDIPNRVQTYFKIRETKFRSNKYNPDNPTSYQRLMEDLVKNRARNKQISEDILTEVSKNNLCVVLSSRIKHLSLIKRFIENKVPCALVDKDTKEVDRQKVFKSLENCETSVLFATFQLLSCGFDLPALSRLFLVYPTKNRVLLEQSCGRIERNVEGKDFALVYDYCDVLVDILNHQHEQRLDLYKGSSIKKYGS